MIKVGLVGFGLSGRWLQAPFFAVHGAFHLKSIVTSQAIPKEIFPATQKAASFDDLLADKEIDLISICTPNYTHFDYAKKALNASKHVLVEKPMTATYDEAMELIELAKSKGKVLSVYQNRRFDSDFMTVQKILKEGFIGKAHTYEANYDRYKPALHTKKWKEEEQPGSGVMFDLGSHLIDQAIYLFGTPKEVSGEVYAQREGSQIDDAFDLKLIFEDIRVYIKSSLLVKEERPRYIVHGSAGSFYKSGIDLQEDHLKQGFLPGQAGFGEESSRYDGDLTSNFSGLEVTAKIKTLTGNWLYLYDNLAQAITEKAELIIKPEQVAEQIKIIESVKKA